MSLLFTTVQFALILCPLVARGRPQLVSASGHSSGLVIGCLYAWDHQGNVGCQFYIRWWDMMVDLDASLTNNRSPRTGFPAKVPRMILSRIELVQSCPDHRHKLLLLQSYGSSHLQLLVTDGSIDFRIVSCSSGVESLLLIILSETPESTMIFSSLSLFRSCQRKRRNIALGTRPMLILSLRSWNCVHVLVQGPRWLSCNFFHAQGPLDGSVPESWSVWISLIFGSCQDDSKCTSQLVLRTYLMAKWWSLTRNCVLSSDCTFCNFIWRSSFAGMWIAKVAGIFFLKI